MVAADPDTIDQSWELVHVTADSWELVSRDVSTVLAFNHAAQLPSCQVNAVVNFRFENDFGPYAS